MDIAENLSRRPGENFAVTGTTDDPVAGSGAIVAPSGEDCRLLRVNSPW